MSRIVGMEEDPLPLLTQRRRPFFVFSISSPSHRSLGMRYPSSGNLFAGKAGEFIDKGDNTYGGKVVVNPSGGLISKGHPLGATGNCAREAELTSLDVRPLSFFSQATKIKERTQCDDKTELQVSICLKKS